MIRCKGLALLLLTFIGPIALATPALAQARQGVLISTGSPGGVYHPLGGSICRLFNFTTERHGLRCAATVSAGAVANIELLRAGHVEVAIVQSDVLDDAIAGEGPFAAVGAWPDLRVLFVAHEEPFTIVANPSSGIATSADLLGKRVNIGDKGSGYRLAMERLMVASKLTRDSFAQVLELTPRDQVAALCAGQLDAIAYSAGHPNGVIQEAINRCHGRIVPVHSERIRMVLESHNEYRSMNVPGGVYDGHPDPVATFGTTAVVVTSANLPTAAAYELIRSVFDDFEEFTRLHPAFAPLTAQNSARRPPFAKFHDGAEKYFRERGLLQ
jgi:TRAP transporter TAXI family solute receptor